jgi:hypothetical protein
MLGRDPETSPISDKPRLNELPFSALRRRPTTNWAEVGLASSGADTWMALCAKASVTAAAPRKGKTPRSQKSCRWDCAVLPGHAAGEPLTHPQHPLEVTNGRPTSLPRA